MRQLDAGSRRVLVNLTDVAYLDATGLGVLVSGLRCAKEYSGDLRVICSNDRTVKIFELTGLNRVFDIYPTEAAALATL
jgi:anti-sigma B factor antagonist